MMKQDMSRRMHISSRLIVAGFFFFALYGILAAILREQIAVYTYHTFSGEDLPALAEVSRYFTFDLVLQVSLMGAGLAICAGALVWLGLTRRLGWVFILGLVGGSVGVVPLMAIHIQQSAWIMVIIDNVCLFWITTGVTIGMREIPQLFRGKGEHG